MPLSALQKIQLAKAVGAAEVAQASTGCPVELSVAQWALESGWGSRQPGNNCFGIKIFPGCCGVQMIDTWEVVQGKKVCKRLAFATFNGLSDCFQKHGELIAKGFSYRKYFADYAETKDIFKLDRQYRESVRN
jgi:flagellum-specific peptidoglycan hydrolase FlgJ